MRQVIFLAALSAVVLGAPADPVAKSFNERLDAYMKVRKEAKGTAPPLKKGSTPSQIQEREQALAEAIRKARPDAKPGEILGPEIKPMFESLLRSSLTGPGSRKRRDTIKEGNPKHEKAPGEVVPVIKVNALYPKNAPLSSVPPSILSQLPKLPEPLEYRFVGRTLILRDRESNLIVDFMKEATPAI